MEMRFKRERERKLGARKTTGNNEKKKKKKRLCFILNKSEKRTVFEIGKAIDREQFIIS